VLFFCLAMGISLGWAEPVNEGSRPEAMVLIPGGEFTMGSTEESIHWAARRFLSESLDYYLEETPDHVVKLDAYYIDKYEITVAQYKKYLEQTGAAAPKFLDNEKYMQSTIANGQASVCRRKQSGKRRRGELTSGTIPGEMRRIL
jgi:formylglycine-generating enzyme required for sulfatase activity